MLHHTAEMVLYEAAFAKYSSSEAFAFSDAGEHSVRRLELLTACLRAIKNFFSVFHTIPDSEVRIPRTC